MSAERMEEAPFSVPMLGGRVRQVPLRDRKGDISPLSIVYGPFSPIVIETRGPLPKIAEKIRRRGVN